MSTSRRIHPFAAACLFCPLIGAGLAQAESVFQPASGASTARVHLDLRIVIPARIEVAMLSQADAVDLDAIHLRQGYIDLPAATRLGVRHNVRQGLRVSADFHADWIDHVAISLHGQHFLLQRRQTGVLLHMPPSDAAPVAVNYRLHLNARATAGRHAWPLTLRLSATSL